MAALAGTNRLASGSDTVEQSALVCRDAVTGSWAACPAQQGASVDVQVYDYANLDPASLEQFLSSMKDVLTGTGMSVQVRLCRGNGALPNCVSGMSEALIVRISEGFAKTTKNAGRAPLGKAYCTATGGSLALVYLGPVRQQARAADVPWLLVLSYAAAHEIGHLLLGAQAHRPRGLMKASWDRDDFRAMSQNHLHFTREQVRTLATQYAASVAAPGAR
jgi:hypothetical protein